MRLFDSDQRLLTKLEKLDLESLRLFTAKLLEQRRFFQTVFEKLDDGVVVTDGSLNVLFMNRRAKTLLGIRKRMKTSGFDESLGLWNPVGDSLLALIGKQHPLYELFESLLNHPREIKSREFAAGNDGDRIYHLNVVPIKNGFDSPATHQLFLLHDATDRYRRQMEQIRARRLVSMAMLASGVAHEIKNPLNSLNIHAQLLRKEVHEAQQSQRMIDPNRAIRAAEVIMEESSRLARIVEDFIQASRPATPRLVPSSLHSVFESLERIFRPECEQNQIHLSISVDPELPVIMLDEHAMTQALRNLLRNAVDAVIEKKNSFEPNGAPFFPRISLQASLETEYVAICIEDNGPGISEQNLEHIFEPYYTTKFSGSGLGLMVVYRIISEHFGLIQVESKLQEGCRFVISLPLHIKPVRLLEDCGAKVSPEDPHS